MTAREGFKNTVALRNGIEADVVARRDRRDATAELNGKTAGRALLDSVPDAAAADPVMLRAYIDQQILADEDKARKLGWQALQKHVGARGLDRAALADELDEQLPLLKERLAEIDEDTKLKIAAAVEYKKQYKAYTDLVPEKELKARFEKDRALAGPRAIEQDLALLKEKLAAFPPQPLGPVVPCPARAALETFVHELEQEVDAIAHRAKCHRCNTENGVQRTDAAKALVLAKVLQLEALASTDAPGATAAEQADFALAKSLDVTRKTRGEDGKLGGKMLGVLVCKDDADNTVLLYGYSGTLSSNTRAAEEKIAAIRAKMTIPAKIDAKALEVTQKSSELSTQAALVERTKLAAAGKGADAPEAKRLVKDEKAHTRLSEELAALTKAHTELEASRPDLDVLRVQLEEAEAELPAASGRDDTIETATGAAWARPIPADGNLISVGGASQSLAGLPIGPEEKPHGVCSAPKMIQQAKGRGLTIVGMAEAWYGEGTNTHGELVASCSTCMKNIGFQLCEVCHG